MGNKRSTAYAGLMFGLTFALAVATTPFAAIWMVSLLERFLLTKFDPWVELLVFTGVATGVYCITFGVFLIVEARIMDARDQNTD